MLRTLIPRNEAISRAEVLAPSINALDVAQHDLGTRWKFPRIGRAVKLPPERRIQGLRFVDDVFEFYIRLTKDDRAEVLVFNLLARIHQHGAGFERAGRTAKKENLRR